MHFDWRISLAGPPADDCKNNIVKVVDVQGKSSDIAYIFNGRFKLNLITGAKHYYKNSPPFRGEENSYWLGIQQMNGYRVYLPCNYKLNTRPYITLEYVKDRDKRFLYQLNGPYVDD